MDGRDREKFCWLVLERLWYYPLNNSNLMSATHISRTFPERLASESVPRHREAIVVVLKEMQTRLDYFADVFSTKNDAELQSSFLETAACLERMIALVNSQPDRAAERHPRRNPESRRGNALAASG